MSSSDEKSGEDGSERPGPFAALFQEIGEMRQEQITIRDMLCGQGSREGNDGVEATAMVVKAPKAPRRLVVRVHLAIAGESPFLGLQELQTRLPIRHEFQG
ncbi:hypothetical protein FPOAC2_07748 [Fusarium poae]